MPSLAINLKTPMSCKILEFRMLDVRVIKIMTSSQDHESCNKACRRPRYQRTQSP